MPEWSNGTVSKTVVRVTVPWVRIPPSPPAIKLLIEQVFYVLAQRKLSGVFRALHADLVAHGSQRLFWSVIRPSLRGLVSYGARAQYHGLAAEAVTLGEGVTR